MGCGMASGFSRSEKPEAMPQLVFCELAHRKLIRITLSYKYYRRKSPFLWLTLKVCTQKGSASSRAPHAILG
ncbi:hypothetical protein KDAU_28780 [Dictyobacter aurantiacus]|uniref:Uncharacterized protein n=1 Tax=Dictyobacter aurantiacus TaxID=1936993 RepID=A0A401ZFC4_9CHLR|nr:hypothetical protein KDAU_28780 [Dictyobacter aurantiacus]